METSILKISIFEAVNDTPEPLQIVVSEIVEVICGMGTYEPSNEDFWEPSFVVHFQEEFEAFSANLDWPPLMVRAPSILFIPSFSKATTW